MSKPYRLTFYNQKGTIERVLPFEAGDDAEARTLAQRERLGKHAVLSTIDRVVEWFPDDAFKDAATRLRPSSTGR